MSQSIFSLDCQSHPNHSQRRRPLSSSRHPHPNNCSRLKHWRKNLQLQWLAVGCPDYSQDLKFKVQTRQLRSSHQTQVSIWNQLSPSHQCLLDYSSQEPHRITKQRHNHKQRCQTSLRSWMSDPRSGVRVRQSKTWILTQLRHLEISARTQSKCSPSPWQFHGLSLRHNHSKVASA
jgi:hypothetical protein